MTTTTEATTPIIRAWVSDMGLDIGLTAFMHRHITQHIPTIGTVTAGEAIHAATVIMIGAVGRIIPVEATRAAAMEVAGPEVVMVAVALEAAVMEGLLAAVGVSAQANHPAVDSAAVSAAVLPAVAAQDGAGGVSGTPFCLIVSF